MQVYFIRHGEAQHNVDHHVYGEEGFYFEHNRFSPLTSNGIQQAINLRKNGLPKVDLVITSSLPRTLLTTHLLYGPELYENEDKETKKQAICVSDLVREMNFHHPCNGRRTKSEIAKLYPNFNLCTLDNEEDIDFKLGVDHVENRCRNLHLWLNQLEQSIIGSVAIVSHCSFIEKYQEYLGLPKTSLGNCQVLGPLKIQAPGYRSQS